MKIAIVGAGLAGLATAYFLRQRNADVTVFDAKGIGGGASGVCSGLLHPYPGLSVRRSQFATEALAETMALLKVAKDKLGKEVAQYGGIWRQAMNETQEEQLIEHGQKWGDIEQIGEKLFWIKNGATVYCSLYLEGLWQACEGAKLVLQKIDSLEALDTFDAIVLAAGYGIKAFCPDLPLQFLKGQVLHYQGEMPLSHSCVSKGYLAKSHDGFEIGSTYERQFKDDLPCPKTAWQHLEPLIEQYAKGKQPFETRAAVRVSPLGHYLPIVKALTPRLYVFTGLGSRGLLYHGYFAKKLVDKLN